MKALSLTIQTLWLMSEVSADKHTDKVKTICPQFLNEREQKYFARPHQIGGILNSKPLPNNTLLFSFFKEFKKFPFLRVIYLID